ncbi:MFS transporter, partial [Streptomyces mirabilis]
MSTSSTPSAPPTTTDALSAPPQPARLGAVLFVIVTAYLMVGVDSTAVNVALPDIQKDLHFSPTGLSWALNAYTLTFGGLLLLGGRVGDIAGRRRTLTIGVLLFAGSSLLGGLATESAWLLTARALQGVGAALTAYPSPALSERRQMPDEQHDRAGQQRFADPALHHRLGRYGHRPCEPAGRE